ncbi:hypothetical protein E1265_19330 [Streptomyces sp. 8K308]|uniref:hypothetical protein n=1 Tax=Streptomyces sp. 8K308 TaxID=2530388 RepID=UPI00104ED70D|nr:hypothetical protein [Streptomyces sp. 8K308]TDC20983.1 hypothetical protein E1265_19330 [Streptomyces sp. 8K308]
MRAALRSLLALALVVGFQLLAWGLVLGYLALGLLATAATVTGYATSPQPPLFVLLGAPAILAIARGVLG